jgi:hypothetical protein
MQKEKKKDGRRRKKMELKIVEIRMECNRCGYIWTIDPVEEFRRSIYSVQVVARA